MGYGLKIRNVNSELQIDDKYVNYVFNGQAGSFDVFGISTVALTTPSKYPPIALIQPTGGNDRVCGVFDYTYSSPNYTHIRFFSSQKFNLGSGTCPFNYRIYTVTDEMSTDAYGLRVKKADGRVVYDSGKNPFKILEVGIATVGVTYTHASHTSPYYIFSPWLSGIVGIRAGGQGPVYRLIVGLSKQSSTSVQPQSTAAAVLGVTNLDFSDFQGTTITLLVCDPNE